MSEYSELIKKFDSVRDYMRDFYVYGFQSREDLRRNSGKSGRSYDNQRRRIESYLGDCMAFRQDREGKRIFLSVDSANIPDNPLFRAFKAKSFTKNDLFLHFAILDLLQDGRKFTAAQMIEEMDERYLACVELPVVLDVSTLRKKLNEYVSLGVLQTTRDGKQLQYALNRTSEELMAKIEACGGTDGVVDAIHYFSQVSPLGVVGSYLLDWMEETAPEATPARLAGKICWKHHYIMHALESQVVFQLLDAIHKKVRIQVRNYSVRTRRNAELTLLPLKLLTSVQSGRRYVAAYDYRNHSLRAYRLDYIKEVREGDVEERFDALEEKLSQLLDHCWGVSFSNTRQLETLTMAVEVLPKEDYIIHRIQREGRHGTLTQVGDTCWKYEIQVWDASEMIPWLRTFLGRIVYLQCTNKRVETLFFQDVEAMYQAYGIGGRDRLSGEEMVADDQEKGGQL